MEAFGIIALLIIFMYSSYPNRVKKLERELKKYKIKNKEEIAMSKMIKDLVNKNCKIVLNDSFTVLQNCNILEVEDEWVKLENIKGKSKTIELIRIDDIKNIEILSK